MKRNDEIFDFEKLFRAIVDKKFCEEVEKLREIVVAVVGVGGWRSR